MYFLNKGVYSVMGAAIKNPAAIQRAGLFKVSIGATPRR